MNTCPHCKHLWDAHTPNCTACGCMWPNPKDAPGPPPPLTPREELIASIEDEIWTELERQSEDFDGPFVDREMDLVDGGVNMTAVAKVVAAIFINEGDLASEIFRAITKEASQ